MTQDVIDAQAAQGSGWSRSRGIWWSTRDASSSQDACNDCGAQCKRGWKAPNGQRYCLSCWDKWHAMPPPIPAASNFDRARRTWRKPLPMKRAFSIRDECPCCTPGGVPFEVQKVYQQPQLGSKDLQELSDLSYCDAHCHLDILLHNRLNGGTQWGTKEKICKNWIANQCWYYKDCHFAHGEQELEPRRMLAPEHVEPYLSELQRRAARRNEPMLRSLITNCCELDVIEDTKLIIDVAEKLGLDSVYCTIGCHPHDYRDFSDEAEKRLRAEIQACGRRVVAVGECGLDYWKNYDESLIPAERQQMLNVFARQIRMGTDFNLPVVVHARDADDDTMHVLKSALPREHKVYIHAFQGGTEFLEEALKIFPNCIFGISSMVWCSEGAERITKNCPLDRMVLETDAPYLAPHPSDIPELAHKIAQMKGESTATVLRITTEVCQRFYGLWSPWSTRRCEGA
mmetsp:Transcript_66261/g.155233  ORF Transcript_66261/g.155233 Transcript_66261/m.155233 type:complete len:456 (-) Transcript_66261:86-1453(-)